MHANDDSLGVRSASVSGSDAEGGLLEFAGPPDQLSSSGRAEIVGTLSQRVQR
jgi:hypothetical protein